MTMMFLFSLFKMMFLLMASMYGLAAAMVITTGTMFCVTVLTAFQAFWGLPLFGKFMAALTYLAIGFAIQVHQKQDVRVRVQETCCHAAWDCHDGILWMFGKAMVVIRAGIAACLDMIKLAAVACLLCMFFGCVALHMTIKTMVFAALPVIQSTCSASRKAFKAAAVAFKTTILPAIIAGIKAALIAFKTKILPTISSGIKTAVVAFKTQILPATIRGTQTMIVNPLATLSIQGLHFLRTTLPKTMHGLIRSAAFYSTLTYEGIKNVFEYCKDWAETQETDETVTSSAPRRNRPDRYEPISTCNKIRGINRTHESKLKSTKERRTTASTRAAASQSSPAQPVVPSWARQEKIEVRVAATLSAAAPANANPQVEEPRQMRSSRIEYFNPTLKYARAKATPPTPAQKVITTPMAQEAAPMKYQHRADCNPQQAPSSWMAPPAWGTTRVVVSNVQPTRMESFKQLSSTSRRASAQKTAPRKASCSTFGKFSAPKKRAAKSPASFPIAVAPLPAQVSLPKTPLPAQASLPKTPLPAQASLPKTPLPAQASPPKTPSESSILHRASFKQFWESGRIALNAISDCYQGRLWDGSANGCTVIAMLMCLSHLLGDEEIDFGRVIEEDAPPILKELRGKTGVADGDMLWYDDVFNYFNTDNELLTLLHPAGGDILDNSHMDTFIDMLSDSVQPVAASFWFGHHVIAVLRVQLADGSVCYDVVDSLPSFIGDNKGAYRVRCDDQDALRVFLQGYAGTKFSERQLRRMDHQEFKEGHTDPRYFQAYVWRM